MAYQWFWGVFSVVVGASMVVFNRQWVERTAPFIRVRTALADRPRLLAVIVGLMFIAVGVAIIFATLEHHDLSR